MNWEEKQNRFKSELAHMEARLRAYPHELNRVTLYVEDSVWIGEGFSLIPSRDGMIGYRKTLRNKSGDVLGSIILLHNA